ncbi:MAG: DUF5654 family protein [Nanoarchaeota archaeon]
MKKNVIKYVRKMPGKAVEVQKDIRNKSATAILAAFAFVIALVWKDAIKAIVDEVISRVGIEGTGYIYSVISALLVTIICVFGIMFFSRWGEQK